MQSTVKQEATTLMQGTQAEPGRIALQKRIGSTTYRARIYFNSEAKETLDDKIRRLLKNDLQSTPDNATMEPLQADWLSERGSL